MKTIILHLYIYTYNQLNDWRIDTSFVGASKMTFGQTKDGKLRNVITHSIKSFEYCSLRAHAMFEVTAFPAFVGASDVILSVILIR